MQICCLIIGPPHLFDACQNHMVIYAFVAVLNGMLFSFENFFSTFKEAPTEFYIKGIPMQIPKSGNIFVFI